MTKAPNLHIPITAFTRHHHHHGGCSHSCCTRHDRCVRASGDSSNSWGVLQPIAQATYLSMLYVSNTTVKSSNSSTSYTLCATTRVTPHLLLLLCCCWTLGLFSGGVLFISAIEFPAALKYSYKAFYDYFADMYPRCGRPAAPAAVLLRPSASHTMVWCDDVGAYVASSCQRLCCASWVATFILSTPISLATCSAVPSVWCGCCCVAGASSCRAPSC